MPIPDHRIARAADLGRGLSIGLDEAHLALREAYEDLSDEQFHAYPVEGRQNAVSIVMHVLQQHDRFNSHLERRLRGREQLLLDQEERFDIGGAEPERLPGPEDEFPSVAEVVRAHRRLHERLLENVEAASDDDLASPGPGDRPRLSDILFCAVHHANAHTRQIWHLRGVMGAGGWPHQHCA